MRIRAGLRPGVAIVLVARLSLAACGRQGSAGPATYVDPTPGPAVTHPPRFDEAEPALRAFAKLIARQDLTYHVVEEVSTIGGAGATTMAIDVAGTDFAVTLTSAGSPKIQLRHVGGAVFSRIGTKPWAAGTSDDPVLDDVVDPWLYLCWLDDLAYTGPADDPPDGLAYACRKPYTYQALTMRQEAVVGRIESLSVVLTADGTPVSMRLSGSGPTLGTNDATFTAAFEFSRVGERIVVAVPKR